MVLGPGRTESLFLPVDTGDIMIVIHSLVSVRLSRLVVAEPVIHIGEFQRIKLHLEFHELIWAEDIQMPGEGPVAGRTVIRYFGTPVLPGLGGNENDSVGCTGTVDCRRGRILQHLHGRYVLIGQGGQVVDLESVHYVQRGGIPGNCPDASDLYVEFGSGSTVRGRDIHSGHHSAERLIDRGGLIVVDGLGTHR